VRNELEKARDAAYYKANRVKIRAKQATYYLANKQRFVDRADAWNRAHPDKKRASEAAWVTANRLELRIYKRSWYAANRSKSLERSATYRRNNPEKVAASCQAYGKKNRAKRRAYDAARHKAHPEKACAKAALHRRRHPERCAARQKTYFATHPEARRLNGQKRRARVRNAAIEPFTLPQLNAHLTNLGRRCVYCNGPYEHLDHFVPLSKFGTHALSNLVPSCKRCNLRKHNKMPDKWLSRCVYVRITTALATAVSRSVARRALQSSTNPP
jgi:5-methylcytosine-specific restriction endonuclease McrA